jgi:hypothetical protein
LDRARLENARVIFLRFFPRRGICDKKDPQAEKRSSSVAHVAQLVEHILGKDEVTSSILVVGSIKSRVKHSGIVHEGKILKIRTKAWRLTYGQGEICTDEASR